MSYTLTKNCESNTEFIEEMCYMKTRRYFNKCFVTEYLWLLPHIAFPLILFVFIILYVHAHHAKCLFHLKSNKVTLYIPIP